MTEEKDPDMILSGKVIKNDDGTFCVVIKLDKIKDPEHAGIIGSALEYPVRMVVDSIFPEYETRDVDREVESKTKH